MREPLLSPLQYRVGQMLQQFRLANGLTQRQLAKKISKTESFVMNLENGDIKIDLDVLEFCAEALNIEISEIIAAAETNSPALIIVEEERSGISGSNN